MRQILYRNYLWSRPSCLLAAGVSLLCAAAYASTPIVLDYRYTNGNRLGQIVLISDDDEDALHNRLEEAGCTDPNDADTDDDGIGDGVEDANLNGQTNPTETNPCMADTDGDLIQDGTELGYTYKEVSFDTDLKIFRPDNDPTTHTSAILADSDGDGFTDGQEDKNHNGRVGSGENDPNQITTPDDFLWGPAWWYVRGVISTNANKPKNDYAAITQGQLKWMALQAHAEFEEQLQTNGGAGAALDQLVSGFSTNANNNTVVNQGQLKNMAKLFYDRLWELGLTNAYPPGVTNRYPWDGSPNPPAHDRLANIGQAKRLFSFYLDNSPQ